MARASSSSESRKARHMRIRKKIRGTAARPRLCVYRSLRYIFAQLVDDDAGRTLVAVSSLNPEVRGQTMPKSECAKLVGKLMGERALAMGIRQVVFDRGGFKYHGRVKALADGAREAGLQF